MTSADITRSDEGARLRSTLQDTRSARAKEGPLTEEILSGDGGHDDEGTEGKRKGLVEEMEDTDMFSSTLIGMVLGAITESGAFLAVLQ